MKRVTTGEAVLQSTTTKRVVSFRLDLGEFEEWRETARLDGRTLSNWIVTKCRAAVGMPGPLPMPDLPKISEEVAVDSKPRVRVRQGQKSDPTTLPDAYNPAVTEKILADGICVHGATKWKCKKWGCPNYENAR